MVIQHNAGTHSSECKNVKKEKLVYFLCSGNADLVRLLITNGALLEAYDIHFGNPLHTACAKGHVDCAQALLNAGKGDSDSEEARPYLTLGGTNSFLNDHFGQRAWLPVVA